jgi:hypothetical protein
VALHGKSRHSAAEGNPGENATSRIKVFYFTALNDRLNFLDVKAGLSRIAGLHTHAIYK